MRLALLYAVCACALAAGAGTIFISAGKPLSFQKLSESVRSRMSGKQNVGDQANKLTLIEDAYLREISVCGDPKTSFEACRSVLLAAEPTLNDLELTLEGIRRAWQREMMENSTSAVCERAGSDEYLAWSDYLSAQRRLMALLKPLDSKSPASRKVFSEQFQPIAAGEAAAVRRVNSLPPWPQGCARYWPSASLQPVFPDSQAAAVLP
ncbi:MAG TPA: hypothetical protein VGS02_04905 [Acidobacteriaceae bacterium]|nr:hypothetical protein [Acidobacteriaceae bacterium]